MERELGALLRLGRALDRAPAVLGGDSVSVRMAENLLRIRARDGRLVPLRANAAQRAFEAARGQHNIVLKARQMGMTTWLAGRMLLRTVTAHGVMTVLVAQNREAAEAIFRVVGRMWENLPTAWREGPLRRSRANVGQMVFAMLDSEFRVVSAADENAGRGITIQNLLCSEVSRWPGDAVATLAGLRAALTAGGESVLESTPNGAYGAFHGEWLRGVDIVNAHGAGGEQEQKQIPCGNDNQKDDGELQIPPRCYGMTKGLGGSTEGLGRRTEGCGSAGFTRNSSELVRHFLPWWLEPAYVAGAVPQREWTDEERGLVARHSLRAEQVGFRRELQARYGALRSQEFAEDAETCFRATGSCCFDVESIELQTAAVREPLEVGRAGALRVWWPAVRGREYIVAVDPAGGREGGDFAAVQVIDCATGVQCAELQERLEPLRLANVVRDLAKAYGGAMVVVERNNHGGALLAYLQTAAAYERVWCDRDGQRGWLTTVASKREAVSGLGALLASRAELFQSRELLRECRTFVTREDGRNGAANGAHDDLVMSMAIAQAVRARV